MTTRVPSFRLAACAIAITTAFPAVAQSTAGERPLAETVITATRTATRTDELVSDVVVIDRQAIESSTARTLSELLTRQAGVQMSANGGLGKTSSIFIRGTESRHTILLIDGVRYGSATAGTPSLDNIPVEMIERIEVLKGPASALYGSEGVGGVVQIFTRRGTDGSHPYASATVGSRGYGQIAAGTTGGQGALTYAIGLQKTREKGFSATNPNVQFGNYNADRDPFDQDAVNGSFSYAVNKDWSVSGTLLLSNGLTHIDDGPGLDSITKLNTQVLGLGVKGKVSDIWRTELRASTSRDKSYSPVASSPGRFNTEQNEVSWQNEIDTPLGVALVGIERRDQDVDSTTNYVLKSRSIDAVFAGLNGSAGSHSWQVNVRRDRNSQFGSANTWFAGYGYQFLPAWRFNVSHGTSFVAPSFNQLYFPNFGNPDLQPERGRNTDVGISYSAAGQVVKLVRFENKIRGFITNTTLPQNVPQARIEGWTLSYEGDLGALQLRASLDSLDPRNELTGKLLPRRAEQQATLGADYRVGAWKFGGSLLHLGNRFDNATNTLPLGAFTTLDLAADYALSKAWTLQARVNNATDRTYETAYGYNQAGRAFYLTLRFQPQ